MPPLSKPLAILYDFLQVRGGAEAVTLFLGEVFPDADILVGSIDRTVFPSDMPLHAEALSPNSPHANAFLRAVATARAFRKAGAHLTPYRGVLFSGHYAPLAIEGRGDGRNLLYCHTTPLPFALDLHDEYRAHCAWWQRGVFEAFCTWLRPRFEHAVHRMDLVIANSEFVRESYARHYGIDSIVIHPPCRIDDLHWRGQQDYYLSFARLEDYKRVDRIVEAFLGLPGRNLVVAADGTDRARLQAIAAGAPNIRFVGTLDRDRLRSLLGECIATLFVPRQEPFGITAVESMAAGKPVIGVDEGGVPETVVDGETGVLLPANPSSEAIREAVIRLGPQPAAQMRRACESHAQQFSRERFARRMRELL